MITLNKVGDYHNRQVLEIECLKADEKPIGTIDGLVITNGSKLHELDGDTYEYDEQNKTWVLQPKSSGGADGREIELQKTQTHIQWRYVGTEEWFDLVSLDEISFKHSDFTPEQLQALKGAKGDKGDPGTNGTNGKDGLSIKSPQINDSGHLILTFSDESTKDVGKVTGENGESAYQIAVRLGFHGTEQEWIESLKYDHSEEFTKLAAEVRNTASGIVADRQQIGQNKADVTQLKEALEELDNTLFDREKSDNLFDYTKGIADKIPNNWAGESYDKTTSKAGASMSPLIPANENEKFCAIQNNNMITSVSVTYYGADKKYINTEVLHSTNGIATIPKNAHYIVFYSINKDYFTQNNVAIKKYTENMDYVVRPYGIIKSTKAGTHTRYSGKEFLVFDKVLCIGDSLTAGVFNHNENGYTEYIEIKKYSYPTYMNKMYGINTTNWGYGGCNSKSWYEKKSSENWGGYDACIIALGANDIQISNEETKEYLQRIVDKLKKENNGIKIFICTVLPAYYTTNVEKYVRINEQIKSIASENNVYLVDMTKYSDCKSNTAYAKGHLTALGYRREAEELTNYISYIIHKNINDFVFVHFINTTHTFK